MVAIVQIVLAKVIVLYVQEGTIETQECVLHAIQDAQPAQIQLIAQDAQLDICLIVTHAFSAY